MERETLTHSFFRMLVEDYDRVEVKSLTIHSLLNRTSSTSFFSSIHWPHLISLRRIENETKKTSPSNEQLNDSWQRELQYSIYDLNSVTERKTLLLKLAFGLGRDTVLSIDIDIEIESISLQKTPPRFFCEGKKFISFSLRHFIWIWRSSSIVSNPPDSVSFFPVLWSFCVTSFFLFVVIPWDWVICFKFTSERAIDTFSVFVSSLISLYFSLSLSLFVCVSVFLFLFVVIGIGSFASCSVGCKFKIKSIDSRNLVILIAIIGERE